MKTAKNLIRKAVLGKENPLASNHGLKEYTNTRIEHKRSTMGFRTLDKDNPSIKIGHVVQQEPPSNTGGTAGSVKENQDML